MPRPRPIIIPGPQSMGGDFRQTQVDLNLLGLVDLYNKTIGASKERTANEEAMKALATRIGLSGQRPTADVTGAVNVPGGGVTAIPETIETGEPSEAEIFSRSPEARKTGFDIFKSLAGQKQDLAYKVGREITRDEGEERVTYRVTGIDNRGLPQLEEVSRAPRYKPGTTVNVNLPSELEKSTKAKIEQDIISGGTTIGELNEMESLFQPEYLTFIGQGRAHIEKFSEKLGIPAGEWLENRTRWFQQAKSSFLKYRKWITGVAGGIEEMKEIAKSYPDPEKNSPTEYIANLKQSRIWAAKARKRLLALRELGINNPTEKDFASIPLDSISILDPLGLRDK